MRTWGDMSQVDRNEVVSKAQIWYLDHKDHVQRIVMASHPYFPGTPPSGSDLLKPELWKACHWNWFFRGGE